MFQWLFNVNQGQSLQNHFQKEILLKCKSLTNDSLLWRIILKENFFVDYFYHSQYVVKNGFLEGILQAYKPKNS